MKRTLIFNPAIHPTSFVLLFEKGSTGGSWTIRDYSQPNHIEVRYARQFDISIIQLRRTNLFALPAPPVSTDDLSFWHDLIRQHNTQYLQNNEAPAAANLLILASSSPRRYDLLTQASIAFTAQAADIDETHRPGESPTAFTMRLAREKAEVIAAKNPGVTILGADTIVVCDDAILGKPIDEADAARTLRLLSGRSHQVVTGVSVISPRGTETNIDTRTETTTVTMRKISEEEIAAYIATGEPMDKAGSYGIQGGAAPFVAHIEGDYTNIVGLPIKLVQEMLANI